MASLTQGTRVTSLTRHTLHAHRAGDTSVAWVSSVPRQTSPACGAWQPQWPLLAWSSWEAVLSWRPRQSWRARRPWEARLALQAWHSWHALAPPESRRASLSRKAFQPGVSRQPGIPPGPGLGSQDFSRKASVPWGPYRPWQAGGAWLSIQAREAHGTFGSSGPHKPWGSWESFATWVSWETLEPRFPISSRGSLHSSETFGPWGATRSR